MGFFCLWGKCIGMGKIIALRGSGEVKYYRESFVNHGNALANNK